ncbi:hypothetical protein TPHA_0C02260 [Tetrapisispora phaffii CBS 4417]|uniref:DASH complex subunit SPC19 n=1 Tax=Tetrapisispora phaffii (strain ATCC 24235 / CBS 4417 / NBRC 1672 / NRRL Y-8282 / UCD 70-5) TaxID=1071381 RepID=G8BRK3_TETPH|nr:hypothetical protein TPHA_0C02260 [Tetrapisispora phaffii CBS 4417]CCE62379.1 hypothetical protein TPHA_0C02260 [Tetrapisispora phaffii CBS 4417]
MTEYLDDVVSKLSGTVELLQNSIDKLHNNSAPNNNLTSNMLQTRRYFELISEYDVEKAKLAQNEEIDPLVKILHDKLGRSLGKLQREYDTLQKTYELNKLRLNNRVTEENGARGDNDDPNKINEIDFDLSTDVVVMASSTNEELEELGNN